MENLAKQPKAVLKERLQVLEAAYAEYKARGLSLDMSRGKPGPEQLDLTVDMLDCLKAEDGFAAAGNIDTRNYGVVDGIPEAKKLFGDILGVDSSLVIVGGNSSLNMMFDYIAGAFAKGVCGNAPWLTQGKVKFLCPAPGYDRHFAVTDFFGIELIAVPMTDKGPDMDVVENYVKDPLVKGMWCVPMYSNPEGITYADETVKRIAALTPAAPDFRIMWDNAYCVHHLYDDKQDVLLNVYDEAKKCGHEDMVVMFTSTSKISFPGAGVAALATSPANLKDIKARMTIQTIGHDKLNMLRHVRYFKDLDGVRAHMSRHAAVLRPKFETVLAVLEENLAGKGIAKWHSPRGGYFVSVDLMEGCAKETHRLLKEAGVTMTGAGATYPYGNDPKDSNLRIAPSYPSPAELRTAMELFCICAEMAALQKLVS